MVKGTVFQIQKYVLLNTADGSVLALITYTVDYTSFWIWEKKHSTEGLKTIKLSMVYFSPVKPEK